MVTRRISLVGLLLVTLTATGCIREDIQEDMEEGNEVAEINQPAPTFQLPDLQGNIVTLEELRGKVVMLDFWATWCGPCRISMPIIEELQDEFPDDLVLLTINLLEPLDVVHSFVAAQEIRSRVLLDEEGQVAKMYRIDSIPIQVVIDKEGVVRHVEIGFGQRTEERLRDQIERLSRSE